MKSYYVTGGTMHVSDASYVVRDADYHLRDRLLDGDFCYVLTPRQMGKSSLMVQTAHALRNQGIATVTLDLSKHGYTLDAAEWYDGLLDMIGYGLGLENEIEALVSANADLSPLQRWQRAIRNVVLECISGSVVIFLDEIDIIRRFKFETDEFFAAVRACYNQRAEDPAYRRLTFCLIGVATPADLIRDPLLTPFNIGTRVALSDFSHQEASQLRLWLGKGDTINAELMDRIYYWTNGHPYLTQRLCKAVAEDASITTRNDVDQCCRRKFLTTNVGTIDDNLAFVSNWMTPEDDEQRTQILTLYGNVLSGKRVADSEADSTIARLKLCGAVRNVNGRLATRNRIYSMAFSARWIMDNMPGQELLRQRKAYITGILRVLVPSVIAITFIGILAIATIRSARREAIAVGRNARLIYDMDMYQAGESWENGATALTTQLLDYHNRDPHEFAWRYLNSLRNAEVHRFVAKSCVLHVAFSPDGRLLAAGYVDGSVRIWNSSSYSPTLVLPGIGAVMWIAFSPDGKRLATASDSATVRIWSLQTGSVIEEFTTGHLDAQSSAACVAFSPTNSNLVAAGDAIGNLWLCDVARKSVLIQAKCAGFNFHGLAFNPDGTQLAVTGKGRISHGILAVWNTSDWRRIKCIFPGSPLNSPAYSPDGKLLAITQEDGAVSLWDANKLQPIHSFLPFKDIADGVAFSHDGQLVAATSWDNTIRVWNAKDYRLEGEIKGCTGRATSVEFSADDQIIVSGDAAGDVKLWNVANTRRKPYIDFSDNVYNIALSPTEPLLAVASGRRITFWNSRTQQMIGNVLYLEQGAYKGIVFSKDGKTLFSASHGQGIRRWDVRTHMAKPPEYPCRESEITGAIAISLDGALLAATTFNAGSAGSGTIHVWDTSTGRDVSEIHMSSAPGCLAFSPDGARIVTGDHSYIIRVWNTRSGTLLATMPALQKNTITSVAWSPDGKSIATTCWDKTVRLWDATTYQPFALLQANNGDVTTCCFSSDSHYLVTAGADTQIKYWDIKLAREDPEMAREMLTLNSHSELVHQVLMSEDSRLLVLQDNGTVRFWHADAP